MADAFRDRMIAATRVLRGEEVRLKRRIGAIYEQSAKDLAALVEKSGAQTLTGRRADVLMQGMKKYNARLWQTIGGEAESAAKRGAELAVWSQTSMLDDLVKGIGYTSKPSFAGVFGRTADEAVASVLNGSIYAGKNAALSKRIWNNEALQGGKLEQIISSAAAKGQSATQLAKALEAYVNPKALMPDQWNDIYPCPFNYAVDYNAKRLAVTALNHAYYQGMIMAARENPFAEFLHWELSSAHLIYDVCDTYMEHDEGLGLGNFSLDNAPLPHPFCRCTTYVDSSKSLQEIGDEIGGWIEGEPNERLDAAFAEWEGRPSRVKGEGGKFTPITDKAIANITRLRIPEMTDAQCDRLTQLHQELLRVARDQNQGNEVAFAISEDLSEYAVQLGTRTGVEITSGSDVARMLARKGSIMAHNHPGCSGFSNVDLVEFATAKGLKIMTRIGNNGNAEALIKTEKFDILSMLNSIDRISKKYNAQSEKIDREIDKLIVKLQGKGEILCIK